MRTFLERVHTPLEHFEPRRLVAVIEVVPELTILDLHPVDVFPQPIDILAEPIDIIAEPLDILAEPIDILAELGDLRRVVPNGVLYPIEPLLDSLEALIEPARELLLRRDHELADRVDARSHVFEQHVGTRRRAVSSRHRSSSNDGHDAASRDAFSTEGPSSPRAITRRLRCGGPA
jgi:hypothetical protein